MATDPLGNIEAVLLAGYGKDMLKSDLAAQAAHIIATDPARHREFRGDAAVLTEHLWRLKHETKDVPPATLRGPRLGLGDIEELLAAGAPVARMLVETDAVSLAHRLMRQDPNVHREFSGDAEVLAAHLRRFAQETADVQMAPLPPTPPPAHGPAPRSPAAPSPSLRAATSASGSHGQAASSAAPYRDAEGQTFAHRMPLNELLSWAGLPPFRFSALGSADATTVLRNYERVFKSMGLDPIGENPSGMHVDRGRAMAWIASKPADLHHLLAV